MLTWLVCTLISIIFIAIMLYNVFNTKKKRFDYAFAFLMIAGFFSYLPQYLAEFDVFNAMICDVVNLFQIVTLNSNSYEIRQPQINSLIIFYICLAVRAVVHISSPVLGTVSAYNFVSKQFEKWKAKFIIKNKKKIYIFSEFNDASIKITECIAEKKEKNTAIVFYNAEKIDPALEEKLGYKRISHISRKMRLDVDFNKLPYFDNDSCEIYFILTNDSDENVEISLKLENYYRGKSKFSDKIHIIAFSENSKSDETIIDSIDTSLDLRLINKNKIFAYKLMTEKPIYETIKDNKISVLIVDFNQLAREILFAVLLCGQLPNIDLKINILTDNVESIKSNLRLYYPEVLCDDYNINFFEGNLDSVECLDILRENCADVGYIVLCNEDDVKNLQSAIMLRRFFLEIDGKFTNQPTIAAHIKNDKKLEIMKKSVFNIHPFGCDNQIYSYDEIVNPELESIAKRVHFAYYQTPHTEERSIYLNNLKSYYALEYNRKSSLAMALSIKYKLWQMGFSMERCAENETSDMSSLNEYLKNKDLAEFSEAEHKRWEVYMRTEGNARMTADEAETIMRKNPALMKKLGNSIYLGKHMDIVELDEITALTDEINRRCQDIEGLIPKKDTTSTDEEIIRMIPEIISNSNWKKYTGGYTYKIKKVKES